MIESRASIQLAYDLEAIWTIITNNQEYEWRSDLKKIEVVDETHFIEYTKNDFVTHFTITLKEPMKQYEFDLYNRNLKGHWIGILKPQGSSVVLTVIEQVSVKNKLMRILAKPYLKKQQKRYLHDLTQRLKQEK